jgi:hypothetical protein
VLWAVLQHVLKPDLPLCCYLVQTCRADGARALEVAAGHAFSRVGWTLMSHGALAVPQWMSKGEPRLPDGTHLAFESIKVEQACFATEMLVCQAAQSNALPW